LPFVARVVAALKGVSEDAVFVAVRENTRRVYGV
jgi:Tat protein secretion system quality control protein TatD with DNase activity